ncbi:nitronate monooxygenase [Synchytrium microbalum]|uniref:Nitronate monooxygenase n=1 Tax=Synchytrium microbalum TaxID=1806994 RepID=A0A507CKK0_9FUNG|nr:nitronate monooxygenase [Synchytrium microbalum]TPX38363.1 nitronate monooxygenase [Synchytrium microbalum]
MSWKKTPLTDLMNLKLPLIQAPMAGGSSSVELVSVASNAGCLGSLAAGLMSSQQLAESIKAIKAKTSNPFSVNVFLTTPAPRIPSTTPNPTDAEWTNLKSKYVTKLDSYRKQLGMPPSPAAGAGEAPRVGAVVLDEMLDILVKERVKVVTYTFGVLEAAQAHRLRKHGGCLAVFGTATCAEEARILIEEGACDGVVAQGLEAGGHRGTFLESIPTAATLVGLQSLLTTIRALFDGTVGRPPLRTHSGKRPLLIAAGGIADGRGVLAALALGADAAALGSVFIPTVESGASKFHKDALANPTQGALSSTMLSTTFTGRMARGLANDFAKDMQEFERVPTHLLGMDVRNRDAQLNTRVIFAEAAKLQRQDIAPLWAGQSASTLAGKGGRKAVDIINEITAEVDELVSRFASKL